MGRPACAPADLLETFWLKGGLVGEKKKQARLRSQCTLWVTSPLVAATALQSIDRKEEEKSADRAVVAAYRTFGSNVR